MLLVDESRRVLLFSGIDRTKPDVPPWWFPVGGGLQPGETPQDAAIRETREETGLLISDSGPIVFTRRFTWDFEGLPDALIAATAIEHELGLATRNRSDFEPVRSLRLRDL